MIPNNAASERVDLSKPRASGDDPYSDVKLSLMRP